MNPAEPTGPPFAVELRRRRLATRLTQEQLAERAGLSARSIRDMEAGRVRRPRPDSVLLLGRALDLAGAELAAFRNLADRHYWAGRGTGAPAAPAAGPLAQLPAAVHSFTGRSTELSRLDELLTGPPAPARSTRVAVVSGTPGVGKTALAVHWAHGAGPAFPDGQLYVDLRGYDPGRPVRPADALAGFLRAFGVEGSAIPSDLAERAAKYRTLLAGRRLLVVLDNASSVDQVRPLLPGGASCAVLLTSRDSLPGLVARDGAHRVELTLLPHDDALRLLRVLLGERVDAEPAAVRSLVDRCARLPLALRVAAERVLDRPDSTLAALAAELTDATHRFAVLAAGDDVHASVDAVFSWSYRQLPPPAARLFRLLSEHPGPDADAYEVAALMGADLPAARAAVDVLARAHLAERTSPGRWGMHDLLRAYAGALAVADDAGAGRAAAGRLHAHLLATAAAAMGVLYPAQAHRRPTRGRPGAEARRPGGSARLVVRRPRRAAGDGGGGRAAGHHPAGPGALAAPAPRGPPGRGDDAAPAGRRGRAARG